MDDEYESESDNLSFENSEELYELHVSKFKELNIKDCVNLKDCDNMEGIGKFFKNDKINDSLGEYDGYKILIKAKSGTVSLIGRVVALYVPKRIKDIYLNGIYKINIENEEDITELLESSKSNLESLLNQSKTIPDEIIFEETYKKVILMTPYFPENTFKITFDKIEIFYYETIIRDVEVKQTCIDINNEQWFKFDNDIKAQGGLVFWMNYVDEYVQLKQLNYGMSELIIHNDKLHKNEDYYMMNGCDRKYDVYTLNSALHFNVEILLSMYLKDRTLFDRHVNENIYNFNKYCVSNQQLSLFAQKKKLEDITFPLLIRVPLKVNSQTNRLEPC